MKKGSIELEKGAAEKLVEYIEKRDTKELDRIACIIQELLD